MTHAEIKNAFSEVYNKFYLKYRVTDDKKRGNEEWERIQSDALEITNRYNSTLVLKLVMAVLEEFEEEDKIG